jgi:hypothetical protein
MTVLFTRIRCSNPTSDYVRQTVERRAREIEAAIGRFRDCGAALARFSIVEHGDTTHLCVDGVSRFSVKVRWPHMGEAP